MRRGYIDWLRGLAVVIMIEAHTIDAWTSLFIYWIHIEMVYGVLSAPIRQQLPFGRAVAAFALFTVAMLGVSLAKSWIAASWRVRRVEAPKNSVFRVFRGS